MDSHKASYDKEPTILTCIKKQYMSFSVISKTQAFLNIVASGFLAWQQKYKCKFAYVKDQEKGYVHMCYQKKNLLSVIFFWHLVRILKTIQL